MKLRFNAAAWERLPLPERIMRCRLFALEAQTLGRGGSERMKTLYLGLAIQGKLLAEEMQLESKRVLSVKTAHRLQKIVP